MGTKQNLPQELKEFRTLAGIERYNEFSLTEADNSEYEDEMDVGLDPNEKPVSSQGAQDVQSPNPATKGGTTNGPASALDVQKPKKQEGKGAPAQGAARPAAPAAARPAAAPPAKKASTEDRRAVMAGARERAAGRSR